MVKLKIIDNITLEVLEGWFVIKETLSYPAVFWKQGGYKKEKIEYNKTFLQYINKKNYCYAGFLKRIQKYCKERDIPITIEGRFEKVKPQREPNLPGINFRGIQKQSINAILKNRSGIINAAMAIGKTILSVGLTSCFDNPSVLFLCRSNDLVKQTAEVFEQFGYKTCQIGDGNKEITKNIVIATAQSYKNLDLVHLSDHFLITIVDEADLGMKRGGDYEKCLQHNLSPIKVALTGTLPTDTEKSLLLEGLFGQVLIKADIAYGIKEEILAKPTLVLLKIPEIKDLKQYKKWTDIYKYGIVENETRNKIIARKVKEENTSGNSVLVFCTKLNHIENLSQIFTEMGINHEYVQGSISTEERLQIKERINNKELLCVISSTVWNRGISAETLDCVLNASGLKAPEDLCQKIGRALRTTENKKTAKIIDILDLGKYLGKHTEERIKIYQNLGWI